MWAAITGLFAAIAALASASEKYLERIALFKRWEYEDEIDKLENEIKELRAAGGTDNAVRADALRLRIERLYARIEHLPS